MSQIVKSFLGVMFIITLTVFGIGITSGMISMNGAKQTVNNVAAEIGNSNFNVEVINTAINNANSKYNGTGEGISITLYNEGMAPVTHTAGDVTDEEVTDATTAKVTLKYKYQIIKMGGSIHSIDAYIK